MFSESDIIAAFAAARSNDEPTAAMTLRELVEVTGYGEYTVRQKMRQLVAAGEWECVKVPRAGMTGVVTRVFAYRPRELVNHEQ